MKRRKQINVLTMFCEWQCCTALIDSIDKNKERTVRSQGCCCCKHYDWTCYNMPSINTFWIGSCLLCMIVIWKQYHWNAAVVSDVMICGHRLVIHIMNMVRIPFKALSQISVLQTLNISYMHHTCIFSRILRLFWAYLFLDLQSNTGCSLVARLGLYQCCT